jgi:hypothetical protein
VILLASSTGTRLWRMYRVICSILSTTRDDLNEIDCRADVVDEMMAVFTMRPKKRASTVTSTSVRVLGTTSKGTKPVIILAPHSSACAY